MATAAAKPDEQDKGGEGDEVVVDSDNDFDTMFDSLADPTGEKEGEGDAKGDAEGDEGGAEAAQGDEAGGEGSGEIEGDAGEAAEGEEDGAEGGEGEPAAGSGDESAAEIRERLTRLEAERKTSAADDGAGKPKGTGEEGLPPLYNADELAAIEKYTSEWGDVARGEQLIRRQEAVENTRFIFSEVAKFMKPYIDIIEHVASAEHVNAIYSAHPDYDTVYPQVEKWVAQQPSIHKKSYEAVIASGTADEVAELVGLWKQATGYKKPEATAADPESSANSGSGAPKPGAKKAALDPAKLAAAKRLAAVNRGRGSPVNQGADPGDFGSAFDEFAGQ